MDIYIAGFPCQPSSTAGKQQGLEDTQDRGTIIFHISNYIKCQESNIFILENVEVITILKQGACLQAIMQEIHEMQQ